MNRRLALSLVMVILVVGAVLLWRPWDSCAAPDELCAALDEVQRSPDVVSAEVDYEITRHDPKDGDAARARWTVRLAEDLTPSRAGTAAEQAAAIVDRSRVAGVALDHSMELTAGEPSEGAVPIHPLAVLAGDDPAGSVAQAYQLWQAGADRVSTGSAETTDSGDLLALADLAADRAYTVSLATTDGSVRYSSDDVVAPEDVRLAVDTAAVADVQSAIFDRSGLNVHTTSDDGSAATAAVIRWIEQRDPPGDEPVAYTLTSPGYATVLEGWVGGVRPPRPESHPVRLPDGVDPWPQDGTAPKCTGDDLKLTLSSPDAAAGSRFLALRASNVSDRPCALDGVPKVQFRNAEQAEQSDVTVVPAGPGVVAERIVVPVGEQALATIQWPAMSTANDPDPTTSVQVRAAPGTEVVRLLPKIDGEPTTLDVLDGAEVRIGPWAQAVDGWSTG